MVDSRLPSISPASATPHHSTALQRLQLPKIHKTNHVRHSVWEHNKSHTLLQNILEIKSQLGSNEIVSLVTDKWSWMSLALFYWEPTAQSLFASDRVEVDMAVPYTLEATPMKSFPYSLFFRVWTEIDFSLPQLWIGSLNWESSFLNRFIDI